MPLRFFKFYFYCCSSTVASIFFPPLSLPSPPTLTPSLIWFCPWVFYTYDLTTLPPLSPVIILLPPLWLLSVCSLFQNLWLYCACLFVLLIRFHLQVRSYGICLSLTGLFHLAQCSPVPSMLPQRIGAPSFFLLSRIPMCKCTIVFDPLIYWLALRLLPVLGYCKLCCYEHWGA